MITSGLCLSVNISGQPVCHVTLSFFPDQIQSFAKVGTKTDLHLINYINLFTFFSDELSGQKMEERKTEEGFRGTLLSSSLSSQFVSEASACFN